jgi:hypothetical protein
MRSFYKWIIGVLLVLVFLIACLLWIVEPWLESKAHEWLQRNESISGKADKIDIQLFNRAVSVDSLQLYVKQSVKGLPKSTVRDFSLLIPRLNFSGIGIWPLLFHDKLDISQLNARKIQIHGKKKLSSQNLNKKADTSDNILLQALRIREFQLDSIDILFVDSVEKMKMQAGIKAIEGALGISMSTQRDIQINAGQTSILIDETRFQLPSGYYEMSFNHCNLQGDKASFILNSFALQPLLGKYEFSERYGYRTDRIITQISSLKCLGLDVSRLLEDRYIATQLFHLDGLSLNIFRDARLPIHPQKHTVLFQKMIKQLPIDFSLDSVLVENGKIRYEERKLDDQGTGHLLFEGISIKGGLLSNDSSVVLGKEFSPEAKAVFMGQGKLNANFHFPLDKMNGYHQVSGHLGPMSMEKVNTILYPLTTFRVKSGYNKNVYFNMELDENKASGDMQFYYKDLNVEIGSEKRDWINNVATFLANQVVISDNPKNEKFRPGNISYKRDPKRSIFNYWWKSLRSGILGSVGLSSEVVK